MTEDFCQESRINKQRQLRLLSGMNSVCSGWFALLLLQVISSRECQFGVEKKKKKRPLKTSL